jgi:hypothetical protein
LGVSEQRAARLQILPHTGSELVENYVKFKHQKLEISEKLAK